MRARACVCMHKGCVRGQQTKRAMGRERPAPVPAMSTHTHSCLFFLSTRRRAKSGRARVRLREQHRRSSQSPTMAYHPMMVRIGGRVHDWEGEGWKRLAHCCGGTPVRLPPVSDARARAPHRAVASCSPLPLILSLSLGTAHKHAATPNHPAEGRDGHQPGEGAGEEGSMGT